MPDGDRHTRARILVAEDEEAMRDILVESLHAAGYDVKAVPDGASLLVELARHDGFHYRSVDLILCDLRMPHCSGLTAIGALAEARVGPRCIVLTAFPEESVMEAAERLGATVLAKPIQMARLREIVACVLDA